MVSDAGRVADRLMLNQVCALISSHGISLVPVADQQDTLRLLERLTPLRVTKEARTMIVTATPAETTIREFVRKDEYSFVEREEA